MQTITDTMTNETIPTEGLMIDEYLIEILNNYKEEFREYFYDKCREIIDYFVNCSTEMPIKSWFFYDGNVAKFPLSARGLFDNIKGLSKMNGLSFIKQFNLADKLKHSPRWVREIALRLKKLALLFSIKTNKINYGFTFDLGKPVSEYFRTLVTLVFEHYSTTFNHANKANNANTPNNASNGNNASKNTKRKPSATSPAQPPAQPPAGSRLDFSLAKLLYTKLCSRSHKIELLISRNKKKKEEKSKEGMHASVESQPASHSTSVNFPDEEKEPITTSIPDFDFTENKSTENNHENNHNNHNQDNSNNNPKPEEPKVSNDDKNSIKSIYSYELCEKYTIKYAKFKLGTSDEIDDIKAFATYCYKSGEKDTWIKLFVENNYTITPYNPLKNNNIDQNGTDNNNQSNQQHYQQKNKQKLRQAKRIALDPKGKYSLNVYLDFMERVESPRLEFLGRKVYSAVKLAESAMNTGNDDKRVAKFVEQMKTASIGARPSDFRNNHPIATTTIPTETTQPTSAKQKLSATFKEEFEQQMKLESLKDELWCKLSASEQQSLLIGQIKELKASKHFHSTYRSWSEAILRDYATNQVKKQLANNKSNIGQNNRLIVDSGLYFS